MLLISSLVSVPGIMFFSYRGILKYTTTMDYVKENTRKTLNVFRYSYNENATLSVGVLPSHKLISLLEPPWLNNKRNESCIPLGQYTVFYIRRSASGKYSRCFHVTHVEDRTGILIHPGNFPGDTKGCLLPGLTTNGSMVFNSRAALDMMIKELGQVFTLSLI